jgi:hypothetical protein
MPGAVAQNDARGWRAQSLFSFGESGIASCNERLI